MSIFKKKQQEEVSEFDASTKAKNKAEYNVILLKKQGGTVKIIKKFPAHRWRSDDHVVYLRNDKRKVKCLEIFPEQIQDFVNYTEKEVDDKIKELQFKLKKEQEKDTELNEKDIEFELRKLEAKKRSFQFSKFANYEFLDETNTPTFFFLRQGSSFLPFKWDTDTSTIFLPSDNRKKSASLILRNKEQKYNINKVIQGLSIVVAIIALVLLVASGWTWMKATDAYDQAFQSYDESSIAAAQRACLEDINSITENNLRMNSIALGILNEAEGRLNMNQTVIEGVRPD